ncbi:hypothetical protein CPB86DRAFT_698689 [Serendipita vermifera]|nr:hypothetical protein CPB86DRAFT_698689 [Serendipita vermifera]
MSSRDAERRRLYGNVPVTYLLPSPVIDEFGALVLPERPTLRLDTLVTELLFEVLEHMDLSDALRFRLVSKRCAEVVLMAPSILKRLLRHIKAPLPYSPKPIYTLSGNEVISLCRRAFALEANWKRKLDRVRAYSFFPLHRPYEVAFVPGGRYLVMAYHSTSGAEHFLGFYDLENKLGVASIAQCATYTPLTTLNATWMVNKGRQGIAVTWVRDLPYEQGSTTSPGIEVSVIFITLEMIETLSDPNHKNDKPPFEFLACRRWKPTTCRVSTANNILTIARAPNALNFYNLEDGRKSVIRLAPLPQSLMPDPMIFAVKMLCDGTVLIVRGEDGHSPSLNLHAIEAYRPPEWGTTQFQPPPVQCNYLHSNQTNYNISAMYTRQKTSDNPSEEEVIEAVGYFPTVTISVESSDPNKGITQYRLYAKYDPAGLDQKFAYQWPVTVWQGHYSEHDQHRTKTRSLAGADRSLGFPYTTPGRAHTPSLGEFMVLDSYGDDSIPSVGLPEAIEGDIVECVTWDESSGKICLSTAGNLKLWVLDFAV